MSIELPSAAGNLFNLFQARKVFVPDSLAIKLSKERSEQGREEREARRREEGNEGILIHCPHKRPSKARLARQAGAARQGDS